ncbi:MAG: 16S rRNA (guanine(966)-N(2))-methyltransferase RsmD [Phycisphaeraceae bacterium JB051]
MRIIGGEYRHRTIEGPKGDQTTRPITDRVKQSVFDRLAVLGVFEGPALDLFSGTGSMGLESLSRGASHCTFIDRDRSARQILESNIKMLDCGDRSTVVSADIVGGAWAMMLSHQPMDVVFCDPPYLMARENMDRVARIIELCHPITDAGGVLVLRTDEFAKPQEVAGWQLAETHEYGAMRVFMYYRLADDADISS